MTDPDHAGLRALAHTDDGIVVASWGRATAVAIRWLASRRGLDPDLPFSQLREIASGIEHDAVHGYTTMHKEHLVPALCTALGIDAHEHHDVVWIDKAQLKAQIRSLRKLRDTTDDPQKVRQARKRIHRLKGLIRRHTI